MDSFCLLILVLVHAGSGHTLPGKAVPGEIARLASAGVGDFSLMVTGSAFLAASETAPTASLLQDSVPDPSRTTDTAWPWILMGVAGGLGIGIGAYCLGRASADQTKYFYQISQDIDALKSQPQRLSSRHDPQDKEDTTLAAIRETQTSKREVALTKMNRVDTLLEDLRSRDAQKRRQAIWELGQRGTSDAIQPLVDVMMDGDSQQRSLILGAIAEIGTRTLSPLNRALMISLQDSNPDVRKNAIRDITRIYALMAQISQILVHATGDADAEVRSTASWALDQFSQMGNMTSFVSLEAAEHPSHQSRSP